MSYLALKHLHMACAALSLALFVLRGWWLAVESPRLRGPWARIVPHVNDTVLLTAAVFLAVWSRQYPLQQDWLSAKVVGLLAHIGLGMFANRWRGPLPLRMAAWALSLLAFLYVGAVAFTREPWPFG